MTQSGRVTWAWEEGRRERLGKKGPMRRGRKGLGIFSLFCNSKNIIWLKIWTRSFQVRNFLSDLDTTDCYTVPFEKNTKLRTTKSRNWMNNENTKRCRLPSTLEPPPHLTSQDTRLSTSTADDLKRRFIMWPYKTNIFERKYVLPAPFVFFSFLSVGYLSFKWKNGFPHMYKNDLKQFLQSSSVSQFFSAIRPIVRGRIVKMAQPP